MNRYLIDTNVISETIKPRPDKKVMKWFDGLPIKNQYISVISIVEIIKGIELTQMEERRYVLQEWLDHIVHRFDERILPVDLPATSYAGSILANKGKPPPPYDALIAATAIAHKLTLVTRNVKDFAIPHLRLFNPWNAP